MKKITLLLFIYLSALSAKSQPDSIYTMPEKDIRGINSQKLKINFDKTIHLVFPFNIKYFDVGSDNVLASVAEDIPFVLKIKANNENFKEETNISVITSIGSFYSFAIKYSKDIDGPTTVYVGKDTTIHPVRIPICDSKNVHLLFPNRIKYADIGNDQTVSLEKTDASNVIRFKANEANIFETNLSIITEDHAFYSFCLEYSPNPETFNYIIGTSPASSAMLGINNEKILTGIAGEALQPGRKIYHIGLSKNKMEFYCKNIFIKEDILFFCLGIKNSSNIKFNIDFVKCFIRDIKRLKNTTVQETEMTPLIRHNFKEAISSKEENLFVLAFPKFTIPDKKKFEIEIFDRDGGRHLRFRIENNSIINAEKLNLKKE